MSAAVAKRLWGLFLWAGVQNSWKSLGGAQISFQLFKTSLFGKPLRTVQFPDGDLKTVKIRSHFPKALRNSIAKINNIQPDQVKGLYRYEDFYYTEELKSVSDLKLLKDNNYVLWTKEDKKLPGKVNIKGGMGQGKGKKE